jgi:catechol 2,3-dioxygenase-like lactoylglutathione lyase family enzyme
MIKGISHITLIVKDLERTAAFLQTVFDAKEVYSSGDKQFSLSREMFFLVNEVWLCIMEGEPLAERTYNHIAFQISEADFEVYKSKVTSSGCELRPERPRAEGEGRSLYFYDFDNHLFELHTGSLEARLKSYSKSCFSS